MGKRKELVALLITRETDYAMRILRALSGGGRHTMKSLCQTEEVPQQFAYKIIRKLAKAGLVENIRGGNGGCQLKADLTQVSLYDLLNAMGEKVELIACMEAGYRCSWAVCRGERCRIHGQLAKLQARWNQELREQTLYNLIFGEE